MDSNFISIGSRGVSIPTGLKNIPPPLIEGKNDDPKLRWANPGKIQEVDNAHGWVSKNGEPFEIYPLRRAIKEGLVQKFSGATWEVAKKRYKGDVFMPAGWRRGDAIPQYVAALGEGWAHGRVESKLVSGGRNENVVGKVEIPAPGKPSVPTKMPRRDWSRDELLVVINLYQQLTFGKLHARNPAVIELARRLERSEGSVAMKLSNFASLDPALKLRGIKGLKGASELDRTVWAEFYNDPNEAVPASEGLLRKLFEVDEESELEVRAQEGFLVHRRPPTGPTETIGSVKLRRGQEYFRNAVLNNFGGRCGVTGLSVRALLVASHILPWGSHDKERLNVRNGLSLSRLHDAAFDQYLITFDEQLRLMISPRLQSELSQRAMSENFGAYAGEALCLPEEAVFPEPAFLAEHRRVFSSKS